MGFLDPVAPGFDLCAALGPLLQLRSGMIGPRLDLARAALVAEQAGADAIRLAWPGAGASLSEREVESIRDTCHAALELETPIAPAAIRLAAGFAPARIFLVGDPPVPFSAQDDRTDAARDAIGAACVVLREARIPAYLRVDPDPAVMPLLGGLGLAGVELDTSRYAAAADQALQTGELQRLLLAAGAAAAQGLAVGVGRGLDFDNMTFLARAFDFNHYLIGHALAERGLWVGWARAVTDMKACIIAQRVASRGPG